MGPRLYSAKQAERSTYSKDFSLFFFCGSSLLLCLLRLRFRILSTHPGMIDISLATTLKYHLWPPSPGVRSFDVFSRMAASNYSAFARLAYYAYTACYTLCVPLPFRWFPTSNGRSPTLSSGYDGPSWRSGSRTSGRRRPPFAGSGCRLPSTLRRRLCQGD